MTSVKALAIFCTAAFVGCSSGAGVRADASDAGGGSAAPSSAVPAACGAHAGDAGPEGGSFLGSGTSGTVCVTATMEQDEAEWGTSSLLQLTATASAFDTPSGAHDLSLSFAIGTSRSAPWLDVGTFSSNDTGACGTVRFTYVDGASGGAVGYGAQAGTYLCSLLNQGDAAGAWTLTITSATPEGPGKYTGSHTFAVHGSVTMNTPGMATAGARAGEGSMALAITF